MGRFRPVLMFAAAGLGTLVAGCALTPRGDQKAGAEPQAPPSYTARYSGGRAMQDFPFPARVVTNAVVEAMEDLGITVSNRSQDGPASQIDGHTPDDRSVTVTLRPQKPITHVSCRVGWFGDAPFSRALLHRVSVRLGTAPPEAIPEKVPSSPSGNPFFSRDAVSNEEMMREMSEAPYRSRPDF